MTYFALKCGGKELHPNRGKMNNSVHFSDISIVTSASRSNRKIKRREVANQNAFMRDEF